MTRSSADAGDATAVPDAARKAKAVAAGYYHTCAIGMDDSVRCWGANEEGQTTVPASGTAAKAIAAGRYHTCATAMDDSVRCWGGDSSAQSTVPRGLR
jgi:alpha-tubulin suppressor-like RCC1 family protein